MCLELGFSMKRIKGLVKGIRDRSKKNRGEFELGFSMRILKGIVKRQLALGPELSFEDYRYSIKLAIKLDLFFQR